MKPEPGSRLQSGDIVDNPKKFVFKEIEAPQLPRTLDDVAGSVINGNYALQSGFNPCRIRSSSKAESRPTRISSWSEKVEASDPRIQALARLSLREVRDFILKTYKGGVVPPSESGSTEARRRPAGRALAGIYPFGDISASSLAQISQVRQNSALPQVVFPKRLCNARK
jgi:hypothetical protein